MDAAGVVSAFKHVDAHAFEILANAKERPANNAKLLKLAASEPDLAALKRLVIQAADIAGYGTDAKADPFFAEPATFVWIYHLGGSDTNPKGEELRYSIRSVEQHFNGEASLLVIGDPPAWYTGPAIRRRRKHFEHRRKYRDMLDVFHLICENDSLPDEWVWMMDDIYFTAPVAMRDLRIPRYQGTVPASTKPLPGEHDAIKQESHAVLRSEGRKPIDYATHLPHVLSRKKWLAMSEQYGLRERALLWEPLYGAHHYHYPRRCEKEFFRRISREEVIGKLDRPITNNSQRGWQADLHRALLNNLKLPCRHETFPLTIGPAKLDLITSESTAVQRIIRRKRTYEPAVMACLMALWEQCDDGFTFLDVGANIGLFSTVCKVMHPEANVIGFEPTPRTCDIAKLVAERNGTDVMFDRRALSDRAGKSWMHFSKRSEGSNSLLPGWRESVDGCEVETIMLDSLGLAPSVIKMDVETWEPQVIAGGEETIRKHLPSIVLEINRKGKVSQKERYRIIMRMLPDYHGLKLNGENWLLAPWPIDDIAARIEELKPGLQRWW